MIVFGRVFFQTGNIKRRLYKHCVLALYHEFIFPFACQVRASFLLPGILPTVPDRALRAQGLSVTAVIVGFRL